MKTQEEERHIVRHLVISVHRQAKKMMTNLMERKPQRSPPSATTLQTPILDIEIKTLKTAGLITLRTLAMPRLAVMSEERNVTRNKSWSLEPGDPIMPKVALPLLEDLLAARNLDMM